MQEMGGTIMINKNILDSLSEHIIDGIDNLDPMELVLGTINLGLNVTKKVGQSISDIINSLCVSKDRYKEEKAKIKDEKALCMQKIKERPWQEKLLYTKNILDVLEVKIISQDEEFVNNVCKSLDKLIEALDFDLE